MKIKILLSLLLTTLGLKAQQSIVTLGTGTSLEIQAGADFCADSIERTGALFGAGTICSGAITGVERTPTANIPTLYDMSQNYPNPFNPVTYIKFDLPKTSHVTIRLYDAIGREAGRLVDAEQPAGFYTIMLNGSKLASGIYFYRIEAKDLSGQGGIFIKTLKMALIK